MSFKTRTVLVLVLPILILDIGIANLFSNTNILGISRTAKYNRQLNSSKPKETYVQSVHPSVLTKFEMMCDNLRD